MGEIKNVHRDCSDRKVKKGTILYVEDSLFDIMLVTSILVNAGYKVVVASSGPQGIREAKKIDPDLILIDYNLPIMSGSETAAVMRSIRQLESVPIVAHTTHIQLDDKDGMFISGCEGFIPKPVDFKTFVEKIEQYLV